MTSSYSHPVEQFVEGLLLKWGEEEALYTRRGLTELAALMASIAEEVQSESDRWLDEAITLRETAEICGYSYSRLEALVRVGELPNAGEKGRPRVRRRDLPRKLSGAVLDRELSSTIRHTSRADSVDDLIEAELLAMETSGLDRS